MMKKRFSFWGIFVCVAFLFGCNDNVPKHSDTTTSGEITISADECFKPILDAEKEVFESLYPQAKINIIYTNEYDAIQLALVDSVRMAIVGRELNTNENEVLKQREVKPRYNIFGYDAIAVIMHKSRIDTILNQSQLTDILSGKIATWKQLNPANNNDSIKLIFDNPKSGTIQFVNDSLLKGTPLTKRSYSLQNNPAVIERLETDKNAIGLIGTTWISDKNDSNSVRLINSIQVVNLVPNQPEKAEAPYMKPLQAYIALKQYPLWRNMVIINTEGRYGLGTGFASFICSDRGQRIILKSGLVPAHAPIRIIQLKNE